MPRITSFPKQRLLLSSSFAIAMGSYRTFFTDTQKKSWKFMPRITSFAKKGLHLKQRICSQREQILSFKRSSTARAMGSYRAIFTYTQKKILEIYASNHFLSKIGATQRKEYARAMGSNFFPFREDPFSEGWQKQI